MNQPRYGGSSVTGRRLQVDEESREMFSKAAPMTAARALNYRGAVMGRPNRAIAASTARRERRIRHATYGGVAAGTAASLAMMPSGIREGQRSKKAGERYKITHHLRPGYTLGRWSADKPVSKIDVARSDAGRSGRPNPWVEKREGRLTMTPQHSAYLRRMRTRPPAKPPKAGQSRVTAQGPGWASINVAKRYRDYDSEDRRQRRLGMAQAGALGAGIAGSFLGGRGITRTTRAARKITGISGKDGDSVKRMLELMRRGGVVASPRDLRSLGIGATGLGAAGAIRQHAESPRNRRYL